MEVDIGAKKVVPAFEMAILRTSLGGTTRVRAPARYAYGDNGIAKLIPPNSDLCFDVTLVAINDRAAPDEPPEAEATGDVPAWLEVLPPPARYRRGL